ncbi:SixA phosphatase family protein [Enemella sp. A6]|uniref:SixA phosphatase family protein n=1 Tax=Enemella sp. A6 TaxID=3440152 RepID=UPI003EB76164
MKSRRVIVMRHSKSSWKDNLPDHERPLAGRGRRDGKAAGELFERLGLRPDLVLCSTSTRTRQTLERLVLGGAEAEPVHYSEAIYDADGSDLLEVIRDTPAEVRTLLLIGHWPAVQDVVGLLATPDATDENWRALCEKFPTSALAVVGVPGGWDEAGDGKGRLLGFHVPRG